MSYQSKFKGSEIDSLLDKINKGEVVTELDSAYCCLEDRYSPVVGEIVPFTMRSGNMKVTDGKITVKPGQRVQISIVLSYYNTASSRGCVGFELKDITNNIQIQIINPNIQDPKYEHGFSTVCQYTNTTDKDCEIGLSAYEVYIASTRLNTISSITVHEIGKAVALGEGATELPIATADTLGGIKVGEGLQVLEDGTVNVISGISGVAGQKTELANVNFEGEKIIVGGRPTTILNESLENYDYIEIEFYAITNGNKRFFPAKQFSVSQIKESGYGTNPRYLFFDSYYVTGGEYRISGSFHILSDTNIVFESLEVANFTSCGIGKVYGIKLGGGNLSAGHIETVIWEGHSHTGNMASSDLCENTLALLQPITNFDKIGVYFNAYDNSVKSVRRLYKEVPTSRIIEVINDTSLDYSSVSIAWGWGNRENGIDIKVGSTVDALSVYSIMADAVKIVGIKEMSSSEEANENNYSAEERRIGTWIDGKPLYQKTLIITGDQMGTVTTTNKKIPHGISNVDTIWMCDGYLASSTDKIGYGLNTHNRAMFIDPTYFYIGLPSGSNDYSKRTVYVVVKYTKTTD